MLDLDLLALRVHQRELWQEAAKHALVRSLTVTRPPWHERWLRYLKQFLPHHGLRAPVLSAMHVVPAVVHTAKHRYGGSNRWANR